MTMQRMTQYLLSAIAILIAHQTFSQPNIPVDPFTGKANVSIPLWTLKNGFVDVPIVLAYTGGGMKVDEAEGNAGIGWNVIMGGRVTREVRDIPDDMETTANGTRIGWLNTSNPGTIQNYTPSMDNNLADCTDELDDYNVINGLQPGLNDTEPDIFSISAPGLNGTFFFDGNKNLVLAPYQDLDIDYVTNPNKSIISFTITRNDGVKYFFNIAEQNTRQVLKYNNNESDEFDNHPFNIMLNYYSSWNLSAIVAPNSKTISFGYFSTTYTESKEYRRWVNTSTNKVDTLYVTTNLTARRNLQTITDEVNMVTANFTEKNLVNSIIVMPQLGAGGQKKFLFDYHQVRNVNDTGTENEDRKYFLAGLSEANANCASLPSYRFEYYDVDLKANTTTIPIKDGYAQDLWGYYNGAQNVPSSLIPALYYKETAEGAERIRINPHPTESGYTQLSGISRATNPTTVHYGSLKRIHYPPGGYGEIIYEPADYYDSLANSTYLGGGVRVSQVLMSDGDADNTNDIIKSYEYKRTDNHSSGKLLYPPVFGWFANGFERSPDNMAPDDAIFYSRATRKQSGIGKTVYEYLLPGTYSQITQGDWVAPEGKIARNTCETTVFKNGSYVYPYAPSTNFGFERGLVSKVLTYSEANDLLKESSYSYSRVGPSPVYTYAIRYAEVTGGWIFSRYKLLASTSKMMVSQSDKTYDPAALSNFITTTSSFSYDPTNYLLRSTAVTNSDNSLLKTEFKYAKDYAAITAPAEPYATAIKALNDNYRHATIIETVKKLTPDGGSETVIGADLMAYLTFPSAGGMVMPGEQYTFSNTSGFVPASVVGNSQFKIDPPYRKVATMLDYDAFGNILSVEDGQRNVQSYLYKVNTAGNPQPLPRAVISQARHNEVLHNYFDFTPTQAGYLGGATNPHTGQLAMAIPGATTLTKDGIIKSNNSNYRFTARVRSTASVNVTVRALNGATVNASKVITIPSTGGTWQFVEDQLDLSTVSSPFKLEVITSAALDLDEVAFYPGHANMVSSTYDLVYGKLSDTNAKGVSAFIVYDDNGRVKYLKDQDKNVVEVKEYQYKTKPTETLAPLTNFSTSMSTVTGSASFVTTTGCIPNVTYSWFVNDDQKSSGIDYVNFSYNFTTPNPRVKLVVSAPGYQTAMREDTIQYSPHVPHTAVQQCTPTLSISITGSTNYLSCSEQTTSRGFTVVSDPANDPCISGFIWQYKLVNNSSNSDWITYLGGSTPGSNNFTFDFSQIYTSPQDVVIRCLAYIDNFYPVAESNSININYVDEGICY